MAATIDFDRAWSEREVGQVPDEDLPTIRMFGAEFRRRRQLPAAVTLWANRLTLDSDPSDDDDDGGLDLDALIQLLRLIVPDEVLDRWIYEQGVSKEELRRAFMALYGLYLGVGPAKDQEGGDDEGEAPARAAGSSGQSSKNGRSSKRTSPANTGRTSPK